MSHNLCLTHPCLNMTTRVECAIRPLATGRGLWVLLCAAGMAGEQPTSIKIQGPFCGAKTAENILSAIAECLQKQGYGEDLGPQIWQLHLQAELRRLNNLCGNTGMQQSPLH